MELTLLREGKTATTENLLSDLIDPVIITGNSGDEDNWKKRISLEVKVVHRRVGFSKIQQITPNCTQIFWIAQSYFSKRFGSTNFCNVLDLLSKHSRSLDFLQGFESLEALQVDL